MAQNMYRVGDYVYFEVSSSAPYQIRRIEELNKAASGNVEAKVVCFYRRRDIPAPLLKIADNAERQGEIVSRPRRQLLSSASSPAASTSNGDIKEEPKENGVSDKKPRAKSEEKEKEEDGDGEKSYGFAGLPDGSENLPPEKIHMLRQRELFLSRQIETLPATHIRGKCTVVMLSEVETSEMYLDREDAFFYSLVYDPTNETLLADKGSIRLGEKFQAEIPPNSAGENENNEDDDEDKENDRLMVAVEDEEEVPNARETVVYHPHHSLTDRDIDQFLIIARAVGTFSRALDSSSSMKLPSLHMTAAAASRDVTLLHAMALLHQAGYDIGQATKFLVPPPSKLHYPLDADKSTAHNTVSLGGPILCRDQLEEWSPAEATLFEEAIEKYGKDFHDIRNDYLPWKSLRDIIEYYYMWKTTSRYTEMQKPKQAERESKLKQVYIPNYNKPNPNLVGPPNPNNDLVKSTSLCESCQAERSTQWYAWGPAHLQMRLCTECWNVWKKKGGLKRPHEYENYDLDGTVQSDYLSQRTGTVVNPMGINKGSIQNVQGQRNGGQTILNRGTGAQIIAKLPPGYQQQLLQQVGSGSAVLQNTKGRVAFFLHTDMQTKLARRLSSKSLLNMRKAARSPFKPLDSRAIMESWRSRDPLEIVRVAKQLFGSRIPQRLVEFIALRTQQQAQARANGANVTPARR